MVGRLTTHVLDAMHGVPAADLQIQLWRLSAQGEQRELLKVTRTNEQGRTEEPLLRDEELLPGAYELLFAVGAYFAGRGVALPEPPFLDIVPIRFGLADASAHYHVPLLVSPWSYSTYRGS
ncbi:MAG TPA: hydroxyisourate hydrolase [Ktedonobacteraceae bacterium]